MSKSVDTRVVEMKFDNKQFENGAKSTISTLAKLKEALKLGDSSKALSGLNQAAKNTSLSGLVSSVEALEKRFSTLGIVGMRIIQNITDGLMNKLNTAVHTVTDSIVSGGVKRAMNIENAHFQLQSLLKDETKVQAVMNDAMEAVDGTAYAYDEAAKAASMFSASGIQAGEDMLGALKGITGVAAMTNSSFEDISNIFTTVAGQGRLMGDQLNQFAARGLNAASTLADYLREVEGQADITEAEVRDMVSSGEIDFKLFADAMTWAFGDSAKRANETFTGALSNIKSALARIGAGFISPLVEQNGELVKMFNALRIKINDVKSALVFDEQRSAVAGLAEVTKMSTDELNDMFKSIKSNGKVSVSDLDTLTKRGANATEALVKYFNGVNDGSIRSSFAISQLVENLTDGTEVSSADIRRFVEEGQIDLGTFTSAMEHAFGIENTLSKQFTDSVLDMVAKITKALNSLDMTKPMEIFYYWVESIKNVFKGLYSILKPIGKAFAEVFLSFNIDQVLDFSAAVENLTSKFKLSELGSKNLKDAFQGVFNVIKLLMDGVVGLISKILGIKNPLDGSIDGFLSLAGAVGRALTAFTDFVRESPLFQTIFDGIVVVINKVIDTISTFIGKIKEFVSEVSKSEKVVKIINNLKENLMELSNKVVPKLRDFVDSLNGIKKVEIDTSFGKIVDNIKNVLSNVKTFDGVNPGQVFTRFKDQLVDLIQAIPMTDGLRTFVDNIKTYLGDLSDAFTMTNLYEKIEYFKEKVVNFFSDLTAGKLIAAGGGAATLYAFLKGFKVFEKIADSMKKVTSVLDTFKGVLVSYQREIMSEAILNIAKAIGVLAVSLTLLSFADQDNLISSAQALALVSGVILFASEKMLEGFGKLGNAFERLTAIGGMYVFSKSVKKIIDGVAEIALVIAGLAYMWRQDPEAFDHATLLVGGIGGVLIAIGGLIGIASKYLGPETTTGMSKIGTSILAISTSLGLIVFSLKNLMGMEIPEDYKLKLGILTLIMGELGILAIAMGKTAKIADGNQMPKIGGAIKSMVLMLLAVTYSLKELMDIDLPEDYKVKLGILAGIFAALETVVLALGKAAKVSGGNSLKAAGDIIALSVMLVIVVKSLDSLFKMTLPNDYKSKLLIMAGIFAALETVVIALGKAANASGGNSLKAGGTILALSVMLVTITGSLAVLTNYNFTDILSGAIGLGLVLTAVGNMMKSMSKMKKFSHAGEILASAVVIGSIAASLSFLAFLSWADMIKGVAGLTIVLGMLAKNFEAIGAMKVNKMTLIALGEFIVILGEIAGSLYLLSLRPWENMAAAGFAMGSCLLALTHAFDVVMKSNYDDSTVKKAGVFLAMTSALIPIGIALYELAEQPWDSLLAAGGAISSVLLSLTVAFEAVVKSNCNDGMVKKAGVFLSMSLALIPIAKAISDLAVYPWQSLLAAAGVIDSTLIVLTGTFVALSKVKVNLSAIEAIAAGTLEILGIAKSIAILAEYDGQSLLNACLALDSTLVVLTGSMIALSAFSLSGPAIVEAVALMGVVIAELGAVFAALGALKQIPNLMWFLEEGGALLKQLGKNIGEAIGAIVGGVIAEISSRLPEIGANLTSFMNNLGGFISGSKSIDNSALAGVGLLAAIIIALTAAEVINGIAKLFGLKMEDMAIELSNFMVALKPFIENSKNLNASSVEACASLASMIVKLTIAEVISGIGRFLGISGSLEKFGEELSKFGPSIKQFADSVKGIDASSVQGAASAAEIMAEMNKKLPGTDGLVQKIFGNKSLGNFADELNKFGPAIKQFASTVEGVDSSSVQGAASAAEIMAEMNNKLPDQGGLKAKIFGSKSLSQFADELNKFGPTIKSFSSQVSGIDSSSVQGAASAAEIMAVTTEKLPNSQNVLQKVFGGGKSLSSFASELIGFGKNMKSFSDSVNGINISGVDDAVRGFKKVVELSSSLEGKSTNGLANFANGLSKIGIESVDNFVNAFKNSGAKVSEAVSSFTKNIENGLNNISTTLSNKGKETGEKLVRSINDGMNNLKDGLLVSVGNIGNSIKSKINETLNEEDYFVKGQNIMNSLISGFNSNADQIITSTKATLTNVGETIQNTLSPETFSQVGRGITNNISQGISTTSQNAISTGQNFADNVHNTIDNALSSQKMNTIGNNITNSISKGIESTKAFVTNTAQDVGNGIEKAITDKVNTTNMSKIGNEAGNSLGQGISNTSSFVTNTAKTLSDKTLETVKGVLNTSTFTPIGSEVSTSISNGIDNSKPKVLSSMTTLSNNTIDTSKKILNSNTFNSIGNNVSTSIGNGITGAIGKVTSAAQNISNNAVNTTRNILNSNTFNSIGNNVSSSVGNGISGAIGRVTSAAQSMANSGVTTIRNGMSSSVVTPIGTGVSTNVANGIRNSISSVVSSASDMAKSAIDRVKDVFSASNVIQLGSRFCDGIISGIRNGTSSVITAFKNLATDAYKAARDALDIHSPSKKGEELGEYFTQGFTDGIHAGSKDVVAAAQSMATAALNEIKSVLAIESPSKQAKNEGTNLSWAVKEGLAVQGIKVSDDPNATWYNNGSAYQEASQALRNAVRAKEIVNNSNLKNSKSVKQLVNDMAKAVEKSESERRAANKSSGGGRTGTSTLTSTIKSIAKSISFSSNKVTSTLKSTVKKSLGVKSPSVEGAIIGSFFTEGLAVGMIDGIHFITEASDEIKDTIDKDFDAQNLLSDLNDPVIKPVVDLSEVEKGASDISDLMNKTYDLSAMFDKVQSTSSTFIGKKKEKERDNTSKNDQKEGSTFVFNQNNYSPQALSRYEIYRQTNNQFNAFRMAVTT